MTSVRGMSVTGSASSRGRNETAIALYPSLRTRAGKTDSTLKTDRLDRALRAVRAPQMRNRLRTVSLNRPTFKCSTRPRRISATRKREVSLVDRRTVITATAVGTLIVITRTAVGIAVVVTLEAATAAMVTTDTVTEMDRVRARAGRIKACVPVLLAAVAGVGGAVIASPALPASK